MSTWWAWRALGIGATLLQVRIASWAACIAMIIRARAHIAHAETTGVLAMGPIRARRTPRVGAADIETCLTIWYAHAILHTVVCRAHAMTSGRVALRVGRTGWTLRIGAPVRQTSFAGSLAHILDMLSNSALQQRRLVLVVVADTHLRRGVTMSAWWAWRALGIGATLLQVRIASWAACIAMIIRARAHIAHAETTGVLAMGPIKARRTPRVGAADVE